MAEVRIGVVADTHVPDRKPALIPAMLEGLEAAGVVHILHAGDICAQRVLDRLAEIAPVSAVRGNRDLFIQPLLPTHLNLVIGGMRIGLFHGQGDMREYWRQKFAFLFRGYRWQRYVRVAEQYCPEAQVWVFGHTHIPENSRRKGRLLFNPGSAIGFRLGRMVHPPSYGILTIRDGQAEGEIINLGDVRAL